MQKIDSVSCGDDFTAAATLSDVLGSTGGGATISGNDAFVAIQYAPARGQTIWTQEVHAPVGGIIIAPGTTGIRFRNYTAGKVAVVSANLSFRSEPPITFTSAGQAAVASGVTFLGRFTGATWPPAAPADGDVAELVDTGNSCSWLMQYVAGTNTWRPYNGDTPASGYFENALNVVGNVGWADAGNFVLPVGGGWSFDLGTGGLGGAGGGSFAVALATTAAGHDILTVTSASAGAHTLNQAYTATKGQTIHASYETLAPGTSACGLLTARFRPVSLLNA